MKELVARILDEYFKKMREPKLSDLPGIDESLLSEKWCVFITIYINGEVHGSAGNIKEIHNSLAEEIISSTIHALTWDKRFPPLTLEQAEKIQYRIDKISDRKMITRKELLKLDPVKQGTIAIKRDYEKLAVVLPNMSPKILTWEDFIPVLLKKMNERKLDDAEYIFYQISTEVESNY